jgi:hypothetical protein
MSDNKKRSPSYDEWERICDENDRLKAESERLLEQIQFEIHPKLGAELSRLKSDLAQARRERGEARQEQKHIRLQGVLIPTIEAQRDRYKDINESLRKRVEDLEQRLGDCKCK